MSLIDTLLGKRGIKTVEELDPEERAQVEKWKLILRGDSITIDTIKEFCKSQITIIEGKCDGVTPLTPIQQGSLHVYLTLLKAIETPEAEREALERYLTQIVNN